MDHLLRTTLLQLGLTTKEIQFYLASFSLGPATMNELVKKSRLERSTAYLIMQSLIEKGFLEEDFKEYKKTLIAADPKKLLRMIAAKQRTIQRQEQELEANLTELQSIYQASEFRPNVRIFDGNKGLLSVWEDIVRVKQEILLWTNQETESKFFTKEFHDKFIQERIQKGISMRVLAVDNERGQILQTHDTETLRETKLLPILTTFSAETYIYGHKVAILDYKKDIIGIIIESEPIAAAQKAIFESLWDIC